MKHSLLVTKFLIIALAFGVAKKSVAANDGGGLFLLSEDVRSIEEISRDHDSEETFYVLEAMTTGCDASKEFSVFYYKARINRSNVKNNIIEFCGVGSLMVGDFYSGYFQGKTKKGLPVLPPDAIFISHPRGYFRLPSYQVHTRECDGRTILIGGIREPDLPKTKSP